MRSTKVMTADRLAAPMIRSPSQCPGTARSAASAGLWVQGLVRDRLPPGGHRPPLVPAHPGRAATAQTSFKTHCQLSAGLAVQGPVDRLGRHLPVWPAGYSRASLPLI